MKYERLTDRDDDGIPYVKCADCYIRDKCDLTKEVCYQELQDRLAEIEDKIESGEIDHVADRDKEIARLTTENAKLRATLSKMETVEKELKARMEKAVELPTIYEHIIYPFVEESYTETIYYVVYRENGRVMTINCGKNKAKAEARLNELKGDM